MLYIYIYIYIYIPEISKRIEHTKKKWDTQKEEQILYASYEIAEKITVIKSLKLKQNHKRKLKRR